MFDKGIKVVAIDSGATYRKGDVFISYGRHPTEKGYFAIRPKEKHITQLAEGHDCWGLVPEGDGWWALCTNFIEVEEEN